MISRKYIFGFIICLLLLYILFYVFTQYLIPADFVSANFIYAENLLHKGIYTFDHFSDVRFDDSNNFLYVIVLYLVMKFTHLSTYISAVLINAISLFFSVFFLFRIIDSRFQRVNILIVITLFMSTQLWLGVLGDEVLFGGFILILAIRSYWKHRYSWLLIWTVVNVMCSFYTLMYLLPLIIVSYSDVLVLKRRNRAKFLLSRLRKTILFFIIPLIAYAVYRKIYFGSILPYHFHDTGFLIEEQELFFYKSSVINIFKYLKFIVVPFVIGIIFYLIKERKKIGIRYYALIIGLIIIPILYQSTMMQNENFAYKNYYPIFIGLVCVTFLFIRDFRSLSQEIALYIFIIFFGWKSFKKSAVQTAQYSANNKYLLASELDTIKNGKMLVYNDNYFSWLSKEWDVVYLNNKHTMLPIKKYEAIDFTTLDAEIIFPYKLIGDDYQSKYQLYKLPISTRQYLVHKSAAILADKIVQQIVSKMPVEELQFTNVLVWKYSSNYNQMQQLLLKYGAKEILE